MSENFINVEILFLKGLGTTLRIKNVAESCFLKVWKLLGIVWNFLAISYLQPLNCKSEDLAEMASYQIRNGYTAGVLASHQSSEETISSYVS